MDAPPEDPRMTIERDDNPPPRTRTPARADAAPQAHERLEAGDADALDPRDGRGQGSERTQAQGRGGDPERGR